LETVTSPGRFERISTDPLLLVDAAHNPHGATALVATLRETFPGRECAFLVGTLREKDAPGIIGALGAASQTFFVTTPNSDRALPAEDLALISQDVLPEAQILEREHLVDAIESLRDWVGGGEDRIGVVTGSIVLIGEVMTYVHNQHWSEH
jgi:dihydrofolate synthase/folylpolyglutamate synthase